MLRIITVLCVSLIFTAELKAQPRGLSYGYRFGLGVSEITSQSFENPEGATYWTFGGMLTEQFTDNVGLSIEALISVRGGRNSGVRTNHGFLRQNPGRRLFNENYRLVYIDIPVVPRVSFPIGNDLYINLHAGPSFNFFIAGMQTREFEEFSYHLMHGYNDKEVEDLKRFEFAGLLGLGFDFVTRSGSVVFMEFRGVDAFNSMGELGRFDAYQRFFFVSAGYRY